MVSGDSQLGRDGWHGLEALEPRYLLDGDGVIEIDQGLPDLQILIADTIKLPTDYLSGGGNTLTVPLQISNVDTAGDDQVALPIAKGQTVEVKLLARPQDGNPDGSDDIEVAAIEVTVGGLKVGKQKKVALRFSM